MGGKEGVEVRERGRAGAGEQKHRQGETCLSLRALTHAAARRAAGDAACGAGGALAGAALHRQGDMAARVRGRLSLPLSLPPSPSLPPSVRPSLSLSLLPSCTIYLSVGLSAVCLSVRLSARAGFWTSSGTAVQLLVRCKDGDSHRTRRASRVAALLSEPCVCVCARAPARACICASVRARQLL